MIVGQFFILTAVFASSVLNVSSRIRLLLSVVDASTLYVYRYIATFSSEFLTFSEMLYFLLLQLFVPVVQLVKPRHLLAARS